MREGGIVQAGDPLEIVTNPADAFVSDLVGASDALRRLSLIESGAVAIGVAARNAAAIEVDCGQRPMSALHSGDHAWLRHIERLG